MSDEFRNDNAREDLDERREVEAANQVCPTCHGDGFLDTVGRDECPDCDGEGVAW